MRVGQQHSEEAKSKMSEAKIGSVGWNKGLSWSEDVKNKISESRMGTPAWNKGISPSDESREKMRQAHLGKKLSPEHREKLAASLREFAAKRKGVPLSGDALESARSSIKICNEKTMLVRAKTQHCITELDVINFTATCSLCGLVPISRSSQKKVEFQCRLASKKISVAYPGQALTLWNEQQGLCAVCKLPMKLSGIGADSVAADHSHTTQLLRGFVHNNCNRGIGYFNDDPIKLRQAAEYVEKFLLCPSAAA